MIALWIAAGHSWVAYVKFGHRCCARCEDATIEAMRLMRVVGALGLMILTVAGCDGGSSPADSAHTGTAPAQAARPEVSQATLDAQMRTQLALPNHVPLRATGPAPADGARVVRAWFRLLRTGKVEEAAKLFAVPSDFQNFDLIAKITSPGTALAVTASLPCGAELDEVSGASGFVVYAATLVKRPGDSCGTGVGGKVRGAILVRKGHMAEWYRLPNEDVSARGDGGTATAPGLTGPKA